MRPRSCPKIGKEWKAEANVQQIEAELIDNARAVVGEGPIWDVARQQLVWVDILAGLVRQLDPVSGSSEQQAVGQPVGSVAIRAYGGLIAAARDGFVFLPLEGQEQVQIIDVEKPVVTNRMNDGKCDCYGRFWAGTMAADHTPGAGSLYCLEGTGRDYRVSHKLSDITVANGLDWSPDNKRMYYIDSPTQRVDVFDFDADAGRISNRRPFIQIPQSEGLPDGMTVDAEGHLWVALFYAGKLRRYAPDGHAEMEVNVPATLTTSCAFGGAGLDELYITTARHRLTPTEAADQVYAGGIFICRPGPIGRPPFLFAPRHP
jgi:sugar lactone lactonase YvrE